MPHCIFQHRIQFPPQKKNSFLNVIQDFKIVCGHLQRNQSEGRRQRPYVFTHVCESTKQMNYMKQRQTFRQTFSVSRPIFIHEPSVLVFFLVIIFQPPIITGFLPNLIWFYLGCPEIFWHSYRAIHVPSLRNTGLN